VPLSRWDPLHNLLTLNERLHHLVHAEGVGWLPPMDLYETGAAYVLTAELPGLDRDEFQITVADGRLVLSGARARDSVACEEYHNVERGHGEFSRSVPLPPSADVDRIEADMRDGVLTVTIPKLRGASRRVNVR
jgi:HSP20 family protein